MSEHPEPARPDGAEAEKHRTQTRIVRVLGAVFIALTPLLYKFFIYDLLEAARAGLPDLSMRKSMVAITGVAPVAGLAMIAFGHKFEKLFMVRKNPNPAAIALLVVVAAAGLGLFIWVEQQLAALGYDVQP
jgi:hypothetical protein